jgi:hypothetical protein
LRLAWEMLTSLRHLTKALRPSSVSLASFPRSPSIYSTFSTAAALRPSRDVSHLPRAKHPLQVEAEKQLAIGNTAEAYGLHPDAGLLGKSGIWETYGIWPTAALFAVAAISKEWYILDEEVILASTFAFSYFTAYVSFREQAAAALDELVQERRSAIMSEVDKQLDELDATKLQLDNNLKIHDVLAPQIEEDAKLARDLAAAKEKVFANHVNQMAEKQLQMIEQQENKFFQQFSQETVQGAVAHVKTAFSTGPDAAKLRSASIDAALGALRGKGKQTNLVRPLFDQYMANAEKSLPTRAKELEQKLREQLTKVDLTPPSMPSKEELEAAAKETKAQFA